ncbi:MAG: RibD family protein [Thermoplasmatota archaeon]
MARPFVHLNCAIDARGRVAGPGGRPAKISTDADFRRVHQLRANYDAILVGSGTILADDPSLRVKAEYAEGPDPIPVILDGRLRTPPGARVIRPATRIYHHADGAVDGATCIRVAGPPLDLHAVLDDVHAAGIRHVLVEGGPTVMQAFAAAGLWDTWTVFQADIDLEDGPTLGPLPDGTSRAMEGGALWTFNP